jgi:hypothetical protein
MKCLLKEKNVEFDIMGEEWNSIFYQERIM